MGAGFDKHGKQAIRSAPIKRRTLPNILVADLRIDYEHLLQIDTIIGYSNEIWLHLFWTIFCK